MVLAAGIASLKNTKQYPFNNSLTTVALPVPAADTAYTVLCEALQTEGELGDITVSGKARNGFQLAFTGSAKAAAIRWTVEVAE